jgi:YVTN family beta-propeller protein
VNRSIALPVLLLAFIAGCEGPNDVIHPPVPVGEFTASVQPILHRHCGGSSCHGGGPQGFAGGLDLTSYEGVLRGSKYGAVVVSGHVFMSHLVQTINQTDTTLSPISSLAMPASRDLLSRSEIETIAAWIRNGARNDVGKLPFPEPRPLGKVYFTSQAVDLVGVLDLQTGLVIRYVTVGNELPFSTAPQAPHNVQIDDQGRYYYVTMIGANLLKKYDALTNELLAETPVGTSPAHVVITADGSKAYVTNFDLNVGRVYVLDTGTMQVTRVIAIPGLMRGTHGARLSHDGRYCYIGSNGSDLMQVIRTDTDEVIAHIPVAPDVPPVGSFVYRPYQIAVRSDDRFIYLTNNNQASVSVIERIPATQPGDEDQFVFVRLVAVESRPLQCEVTRDMRYLLVCNQASRSVSVIDTDTYEVVHIRNVGPQPHGIDITEDSRTAYVTCENQGGGEPAHHPLVGSTAPGFIAVIDVTTKSLVRRIEVGGFAAGVSITPGKGN